MTNESNIKKIFEPHEIEKKWYQKWSDGNYFKPRTSQKNKEPFSILMPPPNVTGKLHMGHALNHTIIDVLIRFKRMKGHETVWIPGQDHAGIATQAVVEKKLLAEQGKKKTDLGRKAFIQEIWKWKEEYAGHIMEQFKRLGDSCDWDYFTFTMDEIPNQAVKRFFVKMYEEGLIYQSDYIVNWDPKLQSAISDAEVEHKEVKGKFYHIHYKIKDSDEVLEIATTRPETIFADTAVAVNPNDDRYEHLIGKMAIVPLTQREVPIIADTYVDMELGTGCLKVTPAHDFNDYEIGKRHDLPLIKIINKDGSFNEQAPMIQGLLTKEARKKTVELLEEAKQIVAIKEHKHKVGHSDRSGAVVEPVVSKQWFLNTKEMAQQSVQDVEEEQMKFYPKGWENTYFAYQRNPRPWCISRQLWWGHQIPIYYCSHSACGHTWASEEEPDNCPICQSKEFTQDPDVLDTWFSSALFPLSTLGWPDKEKMKEKNFSKFYPSHTLVTGFDIIFFWIARMMMSCHKVTNQIPFKDTYIHAIVRDKYGVKMSKSLGNVINPLDIIDQYGCDAMRFTLSVSSGFNRNINLDPEKIEGHRNFVNKIWNAFRFVHPYLEDANEDALELESLHHHEKWILSELNNVIKSVTKSIEGYRFDDACNSIYQFVYEKFCSWFIELSKGPLNSENQILRTQRATVLKYCLKQIVKLLHPVIPFITEEMWSTLKKEEEDLLIIQEYPEYNSSHSFEEDTENMNKFIELVTNVRNLRNSVMIKPKEEVEIRLFTDDEKLAKYYYQSRGFLKELANIKSGKIKDKNQERPKNSIMKSSGHTDVFIPLEGVIDIPNFVKKLENDKVKTQKEYDKVDKKLNNPKFIENAPDDIVEKVKAEALLFKDKLSSIADSLDQFK